MKQAITLTRLSALLLLLLLASSPARALISCSVSSPGFSATYNGAASTTQTYLTFSCTRLSSDPNSVAYSIRPDNGLNSAGQQNQVVNSGYFIQYEEYKNSGCSQQWRPTGPSSGAISGTLNFGGSLSASTNVSFWGCIPASQTYVAGTHTDTVTMTASYNDGTSNVDATGTHSVVITGQPFCTVTSSPSSLNFSYTAMQATAATASSGYGVTCTLLASYSMSVSAGSGVASGLTYTLQLNTTGSGGSNPLNGNGSGTQQNYFVNGVIPADQAGSCPTGTCVNANVHTLLISF